MRILGLDTATWRASVGLLIDGTVVTEQTQLADGSHAVSLLPLIDAVVQAAQCPVATLDAVAVSSGPGSFTGLRIGLSMAKGLACATGARLIAVPTLEALARTVDDRRGVVCAVLDARKGELYAACFESTDQGWTRLTPDALFTPEQLVATLPDPCVLLGDAVDSYGPWLRERLSGRSSVLPFETHSPRGGMIARLGLERMRRGQTEDVRGFEPRYIRSSEAEINVVRG